MSGKVNLHMGQRERAYQSSEATFRMSCKVNRHNVRIWGRENAHIRVVRLLFE